MKHTKIIPFLPQIISFWNGFLVMVFEILGSRIVWPYIWASLFVWTSIIAVILASLSIGYYVWWRLADKGASLKTVSSIYLGVSILFLGVFFFKDIFLTVMSHFIQDIRISSIVISFFLYTPISFFLWLVPPIITKLQLKDISTGGSVIWKYESIWTVGAILWTLGAWFFLIPFFGVSYLILMLGLLSFVLSFMSDIQRHIYIKLFIFFLFLLGFYFQNIQNVSHAQQNRFVIDTSYSHVTVQESNKLYGRSIKNLQIDNIVHAGIYLDSDELLHEYTKYYHLFNIFYPNSKKVVMFWGAAYAFPKSFLIAYPDKTIDVIEIDPWITEIARQHFYLHDHPNLHIYHQDARMFLNTSEEKYDAILGDAFWNYYSIPYQLTTKEVVQKKYDMLTDDGVVILNMIGSLSWDSSKFIQAEYKTYQEVFPEVFLLPVSSMDTYQDQNIMLVALKNPQTASYRTYTKEYEDFLSRKIYLQVPEDTITLTDDFAPVDYYTSALIND